MTINIYIPCSTIPVCSRRLVLFGRGPSRKEIRLGGQFLRSTGFNLQYHLDHVKEALQDKQLDELDPEVAQLVAANYKGLSYADADDDPIEHPECLSMGIQEDSVEAL